MNENTSLKKGYWYQTIRGVWVQIWHVFLIEEMPHFQGARAPGSLHLWLADGKAVSAFDQPDWNLRLWTACTFPTSK